MTNLRRGGKPVSLQRGNSSIARPTSPSRSSSFLPGRNQSQSVRPSASVPLFFHGKPTCCPSWHHAWAMELILVLVKLFISNYTCSKVVQCTNIEASLKKSRRRACEKILFESASLPMSFFSVQSHSTPKRTMYV